MNHKPPPKWTTFFGYDFKKIIDQYPEYKDVIDQLCGDSVPPYNYGYETTEILMNRDPGTKGCREPGETNEQADRRRLAENVEYYIIPEAYEFGGDDKLANIIREMTPQYIEGERGAILSLSIEVRARSKEEESVVDLSTDEYSVLPEGLAKPLPGNRPLGAPKPPG